MARYFKSALTIYETYEDFKETIGGMYYRIYTYKKEGSYDVSEYAKVFKGFDCNKFYESFGEGIFLHSVCAVELLNFTCPEFDAKTKTVTYYENAEKRDKGVRSNPTKMGKFFRKIAPYFNDKQIEFLVNYTVDYFTESVYEHCVAKGNKITEVYLSKPESGRNVGGYSCINASCMKHNDWFIHPTSVYATESWELHYLTNEHKEIGARVLVCKEDDTYSYIYASCQHAGNVLKEKLEELGFVNCDEVSEAFDGAKLLKIKGNGGIVAPYIDYHCDVKDCGEHLEITYGYADYGFNGTGGYIEVTHSCEECGNHHKEDMISIDGCLYCTDCVFLCNHFNQYVAGEPIKVYYSVNGYCNVCEDALEDMGAVYNEEGNEWQTEEWYEECTEENEEDDEEGIGIQIEPKKEIAPGVECIVISGYRSYHHFPIGTVVKVITKFGEKLWDCRSAELGFTQSIEAKDLVVVE